MAQVVPQQPAQQMLMMPQGGMQPRGGAVLAGAPAAAPLPAPRMSNAFARRHGLNPKDNAVFNLQKIAMQNQARAAGRRRRIASYMWQRLPIVMSWHIGVESMLCICFSSPSQRHAACYALYVAWRYVQCGTQRGATCCVLHSVALRASTPIAHCCHRPCWPADASSLRSAPSPAQYAAATVVQPTMVSPMDAALLQRSAQGAMLPPRMQHAAPQLMQYQAAAQASRAPATVSWRCHLKLYRASPRARLALPPLMKR